jgi:hypothetical protein
MIHASMSVIASSAATTNTLRFGFQSGAHAPELDPLAAIDALFDTVACQHAYLDFGSNRGVQLRKVFQPELYPAALWPEFVDEQAHGQGDKDIPRARKKALAQAEVNGSVLPIFDRVFGPAPRCHVCSVGFEPNPHHNETLTSVERSLQAAGAPILIFRAAASDADSTTLFMLPTLDQKTKDEDWTATMSAPPKGLLKVKGANYLHLRGEVTVRTLDVAPLIHRIHQRLRRSNPRGGKIFAKFDVRHSLIAGSKSSPACCMPSSQRIRKRFTAHATLCDTLHDTSHDTFSTAHLCR